MADGPLVELLLGGGHGPSPLGRAGLLGFEERQRVLQLEDAGLLAADALGELVGVAAQRLELGGGVPAIGVDAYAGRRSRP